MDDWERDERGLAKVEAVLGYSWAVAAEMGVAIQFEHVPTVAAYEAGDIRRTQLVMSADQAEEVAMALLKGVEEARRPPASIAPN